MDSKMTDMVYQGLKNHIASNSKYSPSILKKPAGKKYPKVIFNKISDKSITVNDPYDFVGFEVNIYAVDQEFNGEIVADIDICEELEDLVNQYMVGKMRFRRINSQPLPNIDNNIYRIVMQFLATASDSRCHFY